MVRTRLPKVEVRNSSPHTYNIGYLGYLGYLGYRGYLGYLGLYGIGSLYSKKGLGKKDKKG
jgi:hypothetical protein